MFCQDRGQDLTDLGAAVGIPVADPDDLLEPALLNLFWRAWNLFWRAWGESEIAQHRYNGLGRQG